MPVEVYLSSGDGSKQPIEWDSNDNPLKGVVDNVITSEKGEVEFTVQPKLMSDYERGSFEERQDLLQVRLNYAGDIFLQILQLQQFVKDIVIDASQVYVMDGKKHFVTVRSNVMWSIKPTYNKSRDIGKPNVPVVTSWGDDVLESGDNVEPIYRGFYNLPDGDRVHFTTVDDINNGTEIFLGDISFAAKSEEKGSELGDEANDILCASGIPQNDIEANCYVLDPSSGAGILIPVHAANGVMNDKYKKDGNKLYVPPETQFNPDLIGAKTKYGARLVWADNYGTNKQGTKVGLADNAMLYFVLPAGIGKDGHILVMPGNPGKPASEKKMGNAVVAVTSNEDGTGDILWSWHIWVTDAFNYDTRGLMDGRILGGENSEEVDQTGAKTDNAKNWLDRNLGALSNNPEAEFEGFAGFAATYGNHYQWGRKDPFPNTNSSAAATADERPIYDEKGLIVGGTVNDNDRTGKTWQTSVKNPTIFYCPGVAGTNWNYGIKDLWGVKGSGSNSPGADVGKSIFDPCPAGWRVPIRSGGFYNDPDNLKHWGRESTIVDRKWHNVHTGGFVWGLNDATVFYKGGYYPWDGHRLSTGIGWIDIHGYGWTANRNDGDYSASRMHHNTSGVAGNQPNSVDFGFAVRCVRDKDD